MDFYYSSVVLFLFFFLPILYFVADGILLSWHPSSFAPLLKIVAGEDGILRLLASESS